MGWAGGSVYTVLFYGMMTLICVSFGDTQLTIDGKCTLIYLSMILGALMAIANTLEKRL